jgi:peroxiredoxin
MQENLNSFLADLDRLVVADAVKEGDIAPDFTLSNAVSLAPVTLYEALERGPAVLSFYRGDWCPFCNVEVHALQRRHDEIRALGAEVFLIGPETQEHASALQAKTGTTIPILYDAEGTVMDAYRLAFTLPDFLQPMYAKRFDFPTRNPKTGWRLPIPATYIIGRDRVVHARFAEADYTRRMEPGEIVEQLVKLSATVQ